MGMSKGIIVSTLVLGLGLSGLSASADSLKSCAVMPAAHLQFVSGLFKPLLGHIPQAVKQLADIGKLDEQQVLPVTIALQLNNEAELDSRIADMYNPSSKSYHLFVSSDEFNARYAPTAEQVAAERASLQAQGLSFQSVSDNRVLIHVQGTVETLNRVFKTELHRYRNDRTGEVSFAPAYDLQAPVESQITAVIGMNSLAHFHNHLRTQDQPQLFGSAVTPSQIRTAYDIPSAADGSGQTLALFELDGYNASDITGYEQLYGLPAMNLQNVLIDGADGSAGSGAVEVVLDIEMMIAVAPHASKIVVYEGTNSSQGLLDTYSKIASDNTARQISSSWGESESTAASSDMNAENTIFKQMVAQGQSLFAAAGDSGADDTGYTPVVDDPAGQPYVIGVGGTKLTMGSGGSYQSETTWNELRIIFGEGGGGGGVSTIWQIPSWQQGAATADTQASSTMRNVPDVSLNADPVSGYNIYEGGKSQTVGGTSAAAPLWAAFTALVNQQRQAAGLSSIGFIAPALYQVGKSSAYTSAFHDIADGSTNGRSGTGFKAVTGYDNATGWGSFNGQALLGQLSQN
jgi:kumamolisin